MHFFCEYLSSEYKKICMDKRKEIIGIIAGGGRGVLTYGGSLDYRCENFGRYLMRA